MRRQFDNSTLEMALVGYRAQHAEITGKMAEIRKRLGTAAPSGGGGGATATGKRKPLSAAAKKRIALAQRKRWAAFRAEHKAPAAKKAAPKRKLSPAARAKLAANLTKARAAKAAKAKAAAA